MQIIPELDKAIVDLIQPNFENGPWICGGACMSWIQREEVPDTRDIDVYFKNEQQRQEFIRRLSSVNDYEPAEQDSKFDWLFVNGKGIKKEKDKPYQYTVVMDTNNSLTVWITIGQKQWTIQAIKLYYSDNINQIFDKFDITACKISTDGKTFRVGSPHTVHHIFEKIIDIPVLKKNSVARIVKYMAKGYSLTEETYDRLIFDNETIWDFGYDNSLEYSEQ